VLAVPAAADEDAPKLNTMIYYYSYQTFGASVRIYLPEIVARLPIPGFKLPLLLFFTAVPQR
jgi:hypothetical protein